MDIDIIAITPRTEGNGNRYLISTDSNLEISKVAEYINSAKRYNVGENYISVCNSVENITGSGAKRDGIECLVVIFKKNEDFRLAKENNEIMILLREELDGCGLNIMSLL